MSGFHRGILALGHLSRMVMLFWAESITLLLSVSEAMDQILEMSQPVAPMVPSFSFCLCLLHSAVGATPAGRQ